MELRLNVAKQVRGSTLIRHSDRLDANHSQYLRLQGQEVMCALSSAMCHTWNVCRARFSCGSYGKGKVSGVNRWCAPRGPAFLATLSVESSGRDREFACRLRETCS